MVSQQIRTQDVINPKILNAFQQIPREDFVPEEFQSLAFAETEIPLGHDQSMLTPSVEGKLLQALEIKPTETVLEIGTGSGYMTALLANLAKHVYSVDIFQEFTEEAQEKLRQHHVFNTTLATGDAAITWTENGPFDVIIITGSVAVLPEDYKKELKIGGRIIAIVGDAPAMEATLYTRLSTSDWAEKVLFETAAPALIGAAEPERFVF